MRYRIGCVVIGLAMAASATATALAQVDDGSPGPGDSAAVAADMATVPAVADQPVLAALFLHVLAPVEDDVEVPLATSALAIAGVTLANAIVSVDGDLVDVDQQGGFTGVAHLDEGANQIDIVASDSDGNQVTTTLFVVRGDA